MRLLICFFLLLITKFSFCQGWVELKDPISGILGRGVKSIENGSVKFEPQDQLNDPKIDTYRSADYIKEYTNKYRKFLTLFTSSEKFVVSDLTIFKASIKSLNIEDVVKMKTNIKYVYEGYSADSIVIKLSRKRELNVNYSKAVQTIFQQINKNILKGSAMDKIADVLPILDSIRSQSKDSIIYELKIKGSDVFFKVKMIKYEDLIKRDWEKYFKYFDNLTVKDGNKWIPKETKELKLDVLHLETLSQYPEFWGGRDNTNVKVKFGVRKINGELKLFIFHTENVIQPKWIDEEITPTFTDDNNLKHYALDRYFIYSFFQNGKRKYIYLNLLANQIDKNTISIINWTKEGGVLRPLTFMKYPEMTFSYINN